MATITKCQIINDYICAQKCGYCSDVPVPTCPNGCVGQSEENCALGIIMNNKINAVTYRINNILDPSNEYILNVLKTQDQNALDKLQSKYKVSDVGLFDISWSDVQGCANTTNNLTNIPNFTERDIINNGYSAKPLIGGDFLLGKIWSPVQMTTYDVVYPFPMWTSYFMNPDLFTVFILFILAVLFSILTIKLSRVNYKWTFLGEWNRIKNYAHKKL